MSMRVVDGLEAVEIDDAHGHAAFCRGRICNRQLQFLEKLPAIRQPCEHVEVLAYAMLRPESGTCWFVGAFAIHPSYRIYAVLAELLAKMATLAIDRGIVELRSHVYRTTRLSVAFHRKLGFRVTREKMTKGLNSSLRYMS